MKKKGNDLLFLVSRLSLSAFCYFIQWGEEGTGEGLAHRWVKIIFYKIISQKKGKPIVSFDDCLSYKMIVAASHNQQPLRSTSFSANSSFFSF